MGKIARLVLTVLFLELLVGGVQAQAATQKLRISQVSVVGLNATIKWDPIKLSSKDFVEVEFTKTPNLKPFRTIKTKSTGIRSKVETSTVTNSKPNEKPSEVIANTTTIIADIVGVDRDKKLVSVKGPSGNITTVTVKNPALLADVAVGEQVKVVYFDAMAASITAPKKK